MEPHDPRILKTFNFKTPTFLRKLTNTYFRKSNQDDIEKLKSKINSEKLKYKTKRRNSCNIEQMMYDKNKYKSLIGPSPISLEYQKKSKHQQFKNLD
jgi:hypothetical protein